MSKRWLTLLLAVCGLLVLSACADGSDQELSRWMSQERAKAQPKVQPLAEPKQFKPENYLRASELDPFTELKLTQALKREAGKASANSALIAPELSRRKGPLEAFPLDTMAMVGSLVKEGKPVALVTVGKLLYQVRPGDYLGQNYGKVTAITETKVALREIVQDAAGEWIEREANLNLQERSK